VLALPIESVLADKVFVVLGPLTLSSSSHITVNGEAIERLT